MMKKKLKEICFISSGQIAPQDPEDYKDGEYPFIKASDLDTIISDDSEINCTKINHKALEEHKLRSYPSNSVLFAKSGLSCMKNRVYVTKGEAFVVNHLCVLSDIKNEIIPGWLALYLKHYDVTKMIRDLAYPSIKLSDVGNLEVVYPSRTTQERQFASIENIRAMIRNRLIELTSLDHLVKSRFMEMFGTYFEDSRNFVKVGDIATATIGLTYKPNNVADEGIIVLRSGNIKNAELCLSDDIVRVSNIKIKEDKFVRENDILMCSRNGSARLIGKCCLIRVIN